MPLEIRFLSKTLGDFHLRDVNLTIKDNEYFIILGPSGAGKTILLETIAGIHCPDAGSILLDGVDITNVPARMRNIGMVYQDYMLFPHLTIEKNIPKEKKVKKMSKKEQNTKEKKTSKKVMKMPIGGFSDY